MATNNTQQNISINVQTNAGQAAGQVNTLVTSTTSLTTATAQQTTAQQTLVQQLAAANVAYGNLLRSGTATTQQIQQAAGQVTNLNSQLAATAQAIPNANAQPTFNRFAAGANLAAASTSAVVSGLALIGVEGDEVGETLLRVQSAMAFAQSITAISEMGQQIGELRDTVVGVYQSFITARNALNASTAVGTAATIANTTATGAATVATGAQAAVTGTATTAQGILNAVMAANPIGAIITVIVALVAVIGGLVLGIMELTKWMINSGDAGDALAKATKEVTKAIEDQNRAILKGRMDREDRLKYEYDMAGALGKSSAELRKLAKVQQDSIVQEEYANALKARSILLTAKKAKTDAEAAGVTGEAIEKMDEVIKVARESFTAINENYSAELRRSRQLANEHAVAVVAEQTALTEKQKEEAAKAAEDRAKARKDERDKELEELKAKHEAILEELRTFYFNRVKWEEASWMKEFEDQKSKDEILKSYRAESELQKLEAQKEIDKAILDQAGASQAEYLEMEIYYMQESDRLKEEARVANDEAAKASAEAQVAALTARIDSENELDNSRFDVMNQGVALGKQLFEKNKAIQKGLLIAENAAGIAKIVVNTAAANAKAVAAFPTTGGMPFVAINTISGALGIASSIAATAKGLKELGGGSAQGGGMPSAGPQAMSGDPQTGFQSPGASQVGNSISQAQNPTEPVRAYVVSSEITTQQSLDRTIRDSNSI